MKGCVYSGLACDKLAAILRIFSLYGRAARIRSCALRILDAATISMALVIFLVFSTDLILPRISLPAAICAPKAFVGCLESYLSKRLLERTNGGGQFGFGVLVHGLVLLELGEQGGMAGLQELVQTVFKGQNLLDVDIVQETLVDREQRGTHQRDGQRAVLSLLEQFGHAGTAVELLAGGLVQVGSELREGSQFTVLGQVGTDTTGQILDQLGLGSTTDARHRDTGVDGGADTGVEQAGFQEDLAVGDRDHVGRNEGGHVTGLGFNHGERGQRTGLALDFALSEGFHVIGVHASGAFEQTAVEIEHVARESFTAWRTAQQQRNLTVSHGLLRQIVINDQRVFTAVAEVFAHRAARVGRHVLHGSRFRSRGSHHDGVVHGASLLEGAHDVLDGRSLLTNRDVHAGDALALLVDDGVDGHSGLAGLAVTNDQLAL